MLRYTATHFAFEGFDFFEFLAVGKIVDAIDERSAGSDGFGYRTVGEEHKLFDQMMRLVRGLEVYLRRMAFFVEPEPHLVLLDRQGTVGDSLGAEFLRKGIKGSKSLLQTRFSPRTTPIPILSR